MNTIASESNLLIQLIPLFTFTCISTIPFIVISAMMAERKGFNVLLACVISLIPIVNLPFTIWLASKTDVNVLEKCGLSHKGNNS